MAPPPVVLGTRGNGQTIVIDRSWKRSHDPPCASIHLINVALRRDGVHKLMAIQHCTGVRIDDRVVLCSIVRHCEEDVPAKYESFIQRKPHETSFDFRSKRAWLKDRRLLGLVPEHSSHLRDEPTKIYRQSRHQLAKLVFFILILIIGSVDKNRSA